VDGVTGSLHTLSCGVTGSLHTLSCGVTGSLHTLFCGVISSLHTLFCDTLLSQQDESVREQLWSVRPRLPLKQQHVTRVNNHM